MTKLAIKPTTLFRGKNLEDINDMISVNVLDESSKLVNLTRNLSEDLSYLSSYIFDNNSSPTNANGGFVLYPRKANNNFIQNVYKKGQHDS